MKSCQTCNNTGRVPHTKRPGCKILCPKCSGTCMDTDAELAAARVAASEATPDETPHAEPEPARPWWQHTRYGVGE